MKDCMVNGRNPVFDVVKALMMLWVIWGHLGLYGIVDKGVSIYMHNAKIGVNMPVFFVIGGCLAASAFKEGDWCKLISRAIHFMWPQVMIAVCYTLILSFLGGGRRIFLGDGNVVPSHLCNNLPVVGICIQRDKFELEALGVLFGIVCAYAILAKQISAKLVWSDYSYVPLFCVWAYVFTGKGVTFWVLSWLCLWSIVSGSSVFAGRFEY